MSSEKDSKQKHDDGFVERKVEGLGSGYLSLDYFQAITYTGKSVSLSLRTVPSNHNR